MSHLLAFSLLLAAGGDETSKQLRSLSAAGSYEFSIQDGGPAESVTGKFQKGAPVWFLADKIEFFRKGELLVYKQKDKWQKTRTGTLSDPLVILIPSAKVRKARLPHEELATLDKVWAAVKASEEKEHTVLTGELTEKAAKELARTDQRGVAQGGKAQVWLDAKGRLVKYEITIRLQGRIGGAEIDGMATKLVTLGAIGATKVSVPDEAKKVLE